VRLALDPAQPLEAIDESGHGAGAERQPVAQLARRDRPRRLDVVHGLELGGPDTEAARHDRIETVILQPEATQGRK
jgi:hypothetical protein